MITINAAEVLARATDSARPGAGGYWDRVRAGGTTAFATTTGMGQYVLEWKEKTTGQKPAQVLAATGAGIPLKRNPTEDDIINAILYFLSDAAAFLTGVALDVDGGLLSTAAIPGTDV